MRIVNWYAIGSVLQAARLDVHSQTINLSTPESKSRRGARLRGCARMKGFPVRAVKRMFMRGRFAPRTNRMTTQRPTGGRSERRQPDKRSFTRLRCLGRSAARTPLAPLRALALSRPLTRKSPLGNSKAPLRGAFLRALEGKQSKEALLDLDQSFAGIHLSIMLLDKQNDERIGHRKQPLAFGR